MAFCLVMQALMERKAVVLVDLEMNFDQKYLKMLTLGMQLLLPSLCFLTFVF